MTMSPEKFKDKCKGIFPVQFCPMTEDGELNLEGLRENTQFLVDFAKKGNKDVVVITNGSTTEFYANTIEEQKNVIKTTVETVGGEIPVVVGVSHSGTKETVKMAKYAEEVGADCVLVVHPYYHTPTRQGLYEHYKRVADAVEIGVMLYNNPSVSGVLLPPSLLKELSKIENIVAMKDNSGLALKYLQYSLKTDPDDMVLINGNGELKFLGSIGYGLRYKGFVTHFANFAPSFSYRIYELAMEGKLEEAYEALKETLPYWDLLSELAGKQESVSILPESYRANLMYMSAGKAAMDLVGLNGGPLRLPLMSLTEKEKEKLDEVLKEIGIKS